jgi:hypothetical protein
MNRPEFQFLLHCARSQPETSPIRELVSGGINWQSLLELADQHDVRSLLLQSLKSVCWDAVPQSIQLELEQFQRANVQKTLLYTSELLRLLDVFRHRGIPIAAFKGPVLADSLYGDLALREFSDLDVIVHEADLHKAEDLLTGCGYQPDFPDKNYRSTFLSYQGQYAFRNYQTGIFVDLHWRFASKGVAFPLKPADVWSRLRQVTIAGRTVPTLAQDDLALFLAAHGTKEGWKKLRWVCDFTELLRKYPDMNWSAVLHRAQRSHSSRSLLLAVVLASTLLDAPAPVDLINKGQSDSAVRALAQQAQLRMLTASPQGEVEEFLNSLNAYDKFRPKLWLTLSLLTTRTVGDYRAMPLPKPLWAIYYVTRPFRLASKLAEMMLRNG